MSIIHSINISKGGVPKTSVNGAEVTFDGFIGDKQNDLKHHGGKLKAVCLYSLDLIEKLNLEGHLIFPGSTGENLTLSGFDWNVMRIGLKLMIGDTIIKLTGPAKPCKTISSSFNSGMYLRIDEKKFPGWSRWYASVIKEGRIRLGDAVLLIEG
ncbi:MAG: sulfurase [Euryarchaeota archaeon]|nr:sulfurase [Euryarchaeota archaeon]